MVGEMSTSRHDVFQIKYFFNTLSTSYLKYTGEKLSFRLVVIDYSWASIHSILGSLNYEDPITYANRVLKLVNNEITIDTDNKTWIASCAAHTMHRFTKSIKKNLKMDKESYMFYSFCFSLLLNCKSLEEIKSYFSSLVIVSKSKFLNNSCKKEFEKLRTAIRTRPCANDIEKMLENSFNDIESKNQFFGCDNCFKNEISKTKEHIEEEELQEYEKSFIENFQEKESTKKLCKETELKKTKISIKEKSPFTIIFRNLYKNLENEMSKFDDFSLNSNTDNNYYQQNLIEFLLEKFMPYCFIWASFSLRGLSFSRITNGIVEKYNQFTKKGVPKNILPHRYLIDVSDVIKGILVSLFV